MNIEYLNTLPEMENRYGVQLDEGEKVVFAAKLSTFGTEKDRALGIDSRFTLTNKRIIADNGAGIWTVDIADDVISINKVQGGKFIFKYVYFEVKLNKEVIFDDGKNKLVGFHFYFGKEDTLEFEKIINNLIK